jgi:hypothetical protein
MDALSELYGVQLSEFEIATTEGLGATRLGSWLRKGRFLWRQLVSDADEDDQPTRQALPRHTEEAMTIAEWEAAYPERAKEGAEIAERVAADYHLGLERDSDADTVDEDLWNSDWVSDKSENDTDTEITISSSNANYGQGDPRDRTATRADSSGQSGLGAWLVDQYQSFNNDLHPHAQEALSAGLSSLGKLGKRAVERYSRSLHASRMAA